MVPGLKNVLNDLLLGAVIVAYRGDRHVQDSVPLLARGGPRG
jgi:hypothetical protein